MNIYQYLRLLVLAVKHPRVSFAKMKAKIRPGTPPAFPGVVALSLFSGCNLTCKMCGQWRQKQTKNVDFLPAATWSRVLQEIADHKSELYIWGGEPTLHPEFAVILEIIGRLRISCTINTNGTMLEKYAENIVRSGIDSLDISLDGPAEVHDFIRGGQGTFSRVLGGIKAIEIAARKCQIKKPLIKAVITISEWNHQSVYDLLTTIERIQGIDMSIVQLGWFIPESAGMKYEERLHCEFQVLPTRWRGFANNSMAQLVEPVSNLLLKLKNDKKLHKPVLCFPDLPAEKIRAYYQDYSDSFGNKRCRSLDRELHILADGRVALCLDWPDLTFGKVPEQTLQEIWKGEKLGAFRKNLERNGLLSVCNRCCGQFR